MGLHAQAERDLGTALESPGDWGRPFVLTDPDGFESPVQLYGRRGDIGELMDLATGVTFSGRHVTLSVRSSTILGVGGFSSLPVGIDDSDAKPWTVLFDLLGSSPSASSTNFFRVAESRPDDDLGIQTLILETYAVASGGGG